MPPFVIVVYVGTLVAVLAYVYSVWERKARLRRRSDERQRAGRERYVGRIENDIRPE